MPEPAPSGEAAVPPWRARRRPPAPPVSTYRLQLRAEFGFTDAAGIAGYLAALGVTHVYLSPILEAVPGSAHGYDVIDHSRVSGALGGEEGFREMVAALRGHGLGVVVDVVPNHMAIPVPESLNRQLWSLLAEGPGSRYAHWFDVDWAAQDGRFLLPILGAPLPDCLADLVVTPAAGGAGAGPADTGSAGSGSAGTGSAETGSAETGPAETGPVLRYFDHVLPIRAGTAGLPLPGLLAAQHYRLAYWRDAATELNWRRFFDVTSLIAVRVEDPRVFAATHRVPLRLLAEGLIDGLRIDHPDGLADPRGYLRRLAAETGGAWVVTEKILGDGEELPGDWQCAGTTGYDALGMVDGLFTDQAGAPALTKVYQDFTGGPSAFADVAEPAKRETAHRTFAAEVSRLVRLAAAAGLTGAAAGDLREVLAELLAGFGVYRAYVVPGETPGPVPVAEVEAAAAAARRHLPPRLRPLLDAVRDLALGRWDGRDGAAFVTVFQQTCGPVMAKGVEDTAFYRWSRLVARNEVGGEPGRVGVSPAEFHAFAGRLARAWPATMTTLSTHDTKRQEDVRARLAALAEFPLAWAREVAGWHDRAVALTGGRAPEPDTEYLLWQTLAGAWPVGQQRLAGYLRKAIREAKTATSWTDPDEGYEATVAAFAEAVLADPALTASVENFAASLAPAARANSLGAKLVQLTMPGVADVYQGCELTGFSLVDPDNRRPVDFPLRARLLGAGRPADPGRAGTGPARDSVASRDPAARLDREKLLVTAAALRLRRDHPDWFGGAYLPLPAEGPADRHAVAFARGGRAVTVATRLPVTLAAAGGWAGTVLPLPAPEPGWRDLLTGVTHPGPRPRLAALTRYLPVALLVPAGSAQPGTPVTTPSERGE